MTKNLKAIELLMKDVFDSSNANGSTILITGSNGLIGSALKRVLMRAGFKVKCLDVIGEGDDFGDVRDASRVNKAVEGCSGVIHLAAVSRVIHGELDPEKCWDVNVNGITNVITAILQQEEKPWLIFSSSREVYGNAKEFPVSELQPCAPINIYGESKVRSEVLVEEAVRDMGLQAAILRLSNVYGGLNDYEDRVIPAFIRAAIQGNFLRVDGDDNTFDFTYIDDVIHGILLTINYLTINEESLAPVHFVTGSPTTLRELAEKAITITGSNSAILSAEARDYDVARFYGCVERAGEILGWYHKTSIERGLINLAELLKKHLDMTVLKI